MSWYMVGGWGVVAVLLMILVNRLSLILERLRAMQQIQLDAIASAESNLKHIREELVALQRRAAGPG